jgi:hypothetical protein
MLCHPGAIVEIHGLENAPHLNGLRGTVISGGARMHSGRRDAVHPTLSARISVLVVGEGKKSIRHTNLTAVAPLEPFAEDFTASDHTIPRDCELSMAEEDYDSSSAPWIWEYDSSSPYGGSEPAWTRYPARIESGAESMYELSTITGDFSHYLFRPGQLCDGIMERLHRTMSSEIEMDFSLKPPPGVSSRRMVFGTVLSELDMYSGFSRAVRRRRRSDEGPNYVLG